jgi:predicted enzyme related to lactoylglutathione lyase
MKIQLCPKTLAGVTTSQNAIQLRFVVESVKESIDIAIKNDGTVLQNASKFEGQSVASIRDPDGYSIVLIGDAD